MKSGPTKPLIHKGSDQTDQTNGPNGPDQRTKRTTPYKGGPAVRTVLWGLER